ncbi:Metalloenzyme, LuxS/M16 peptidase-like protein [Polychytrium aggregatum]|uniref:Metalloenzyme, LuxS/M16 peptidase-like protein n=1 Tax=Polychytrium aggregatum TaxID=110093 RepID=UPI0022FE558E|nr:Metalloenzyme, LuxS/M16 peptidase-like protein [Polychytrium aggregatum]KAI9201919.1 Metalloenzyme, LuxS/M16 peptidase-like protein [Polychytrium aggregatum]
MAAQHSFSLASQVPWELPLTKTTVEEFKHSRSDFRIVVVKVPGPLVSTTIVVPTLSQDNKGLPHTLEHLVFCGSKHFENRGYLDYLATRCLSTGTNAYTTEDHTGYTITTAGAEGMLEIIPVFLDHVLHPTLRPAQFMTEVYHLDGDAKHQGVVYCEMASRENTEFDLLDLNMRQLLYSSDSTYAFECGGKTVDIVKLTNEEIIAYHKQFYHLDSLTMVVCGQIEAEQIFAKLNEIPSILSSSAERRPAEGLVTSPFRLKTEVTETSRRVPFPSSDDEVGTIGYGWRGPQSSDLKTCVSLEVIFRYLQDTSASPFYQEFVERAVPFASEVDFELKSYLESAFMLYFSGVPHPSNNALDSRASHRQLPNSATHGHDADDDDGDDADEDDDDEEDDDDDEDDEDGDDEDDDEEETMVGAHSAQGHDGDDQDGHHSAPQNLFEADVFRQMVTGVLRDFVSNIDDRVLTRIRQAASRHLRKVYELLEDDPHDAAASWLLPDILRCHFSRTQGGCDDQAPPLPFGTRSGIFAILKELMDEPADYWATLIQKWCLDAPMVEIMMIPDAGLAKELEERAVRERAERTDALGDAGLGKLRAALQVALKENEVNIPPAVLGKMPAVPDVSKCPQLKIETVVQDLVDRNRPFNAVHVVRTETVFVHMRLGLNTTMVPPADRPFLVLLQELLFQTALGVPSPNGIERTSYQDVVQHSSELFVDHEAAVGFGNNIWSTSWLSEVFMLSGNAEQHRFSEMMEFFCKVLLFSQFEEERILTVAKNLSSEIAEIKRNGSSMLTAIQTRLAFANVLPVDEVGSAGPDNPLCNDIAISIFKQEAFLKQVIKLIKDNQGQAVADGLDRVRQILVQSSDPASLGSGPSIVGGFVQIAVPTDLPDSEAGVLTNRFLEIWDRLHATFMDAREPAPSGSPKGIKRARIGSLSETQSNAGPDIAAAANSAVRRPFPFPRVAYSRSQLDSRFGQGVVTPISGLATFFLEQVVPCDILSPHPHPDYYAVTLLAELLSRAEGPLYLAIRGQGYAYGASVNVYLWTGMLSFELYDASEPHRGLLAFYDILEQLATESGFDSLCSEFNLQTARASAAYKACASRSTASGLIVGTLRSMLRGFTSIQEEDAHRKQLYLVTRSDLKRVYVQYFRRFLDERERLTVITSPPGQATSDLIESFARAPTAKEMPILSELGSPKDDSKYTLELRETQVQELQI